MKPHAWQRAVTLADAMQRRLRARAPQLAAVRPLAVLGFVFGANLCALALARATTWGSPRVANPNVMTMAITLGCFAVANVWLAKQWRERQALSPGHRFGLWWSPAMGVLVIVGIMSPPVVFSGAFAHFVRTSIGRDDFVKAAQQMQIPEQVSDTISTPVGLVRVPGRRILILDVPRAEQFCEDSFRKWDWTKLSYGEHWPPLSRGCNGSEPTLELMERTTGLETVASAHRLNQPYVLNEPNSMMGLLSVVFILSAILSLAGVVSLRTLASLGIALLTSLMVMVLFKEVLTQVGALPTKPPRGGVLPLLGIVISVISLGWAAFARERRPETDYLVVGGVLSFPVAMTVWWIIRPGDFVTQTVALPFSYEPPIGHWMIAGAVAGVIVLSPLINWAFSRYRSLPRR